MNRVIVKGNLVKDCTYKEKEDGKKIAQGVIALNRGKNRDGEDLGADFPNIVAFGHHADFLKRFGKKGRAFLIEGKIRTGSFDKEDGTRVFTTSIFVTSIEFADSKREDEQSAEPQECEGEFMEVPEGEDLPFK